MQTNTTPSAIVPTYRVLIKALLLNRKDFTTDGLIYGHILDTEGREAAEKAMQYNEDFIERTAKYAQTDIWGNPLEKNIPIITGVSVKNDIVGKIYHLPHPYRHHHVLRTTPYSEDVRAFKNYPDEQGFIVNNEYHVNRSVALDIAINANQLNDRPTYGGRLYSENVWAHWDSASQEETDKLVKVITIQKQVKSDAIDLDNSIKGNL